MNRSAAILYPGEMGSALARVLVTAGWRVSSCLKGRSSLSRREADAAGIQDLERLDDVVTAADLVISLVPPGAAVSVAGPVAEAARRTGRRPLYLDANSIAPETVRAVAATVEEAGLDCVDGAFVGTAASLGARTTLYLSGSRAEALAALFGDALSSVVIGPEVGDASGFKLAFAGFNKGLVALFLEVTAAAGGIGQREELLRRLRLFYPETVKTVERLLPSYPRHAARRAEEMAELAGWVRSGGSRAPMAEGASEVLRRFTALGLDRSQDWDLDGVLDACSRAGFLQDGPKPD